MTTTQQLRLIIAGLLLALAGTIYYYNIKEADVIINDSECLDYSKYKPSTLKTGLVGDMVSIYRNNQLRTINGSSAGMNDAYSIWFDLDTIKKFIYHIERGVKENGDSTKTNKLGLRMYYAAYPDHTTWTPSIYKDLSGFGADTSKHNYEFKHTLVLLPTIHVGGNELDFNPFNAATFTTGLPKYTKPTVNAEPVEIDTSATAAVEVFAITGSKDLADPKPEPGTVSRNHGTLCPPGNTVGLGF